MLHHENLIAVIQVTIDLGRKTVGRRLSPGVDHSPDPEYLARGLNEVR